MDTASTSTAITAPTFSAVIDQTYLIEPLQGASSPVSYLDRFPDTVYTKSLDSHLVRFLYALIGPAGVAMVKTSLLQARLIFEAQGLNTFDMDSFYGNPFQFGRIVEETYNQNLQGLLAPDQWDKIYAQDEAYRTRCIDFFKGVRAGNSPLGMQLVAKSGLGHDVEIVENYQYLYDLHTDDPLGLPYQGSTTFLEEFVVLPRQELPQSTQQQLAFLAPYADAGVFYLAYMGQMTGPISVGASNLDLQKALQGLGSIGAGNVQVRGGPNPNPFGIYFRGSLSNEQTNTVQVTSEVFQTEVSGNVHVDMSTAVTQSGFEAYNEVVNVSDQNKYDLQTALDLIRPVHTFPTVDIASGKTSRQAWLSVTESSKHVESRTFVTGTDAIPWPSIDLTSAQWIEPDVEKQAPQVQNYKPYHYTNFYRPAAVYAYTDAAVADPDYLADITVLANYTSQRTGPFSDAQIALFPFFAPFNQGGQGYPPFACLNPQPDPIFATEQTKSGTQLFNYYYPTNYLALGSTPQRATNFYYSSSQLASYFGYYYNFFYSGGAFAPFWSSSDRADGADYLEIDLGSVQAVNFITFETTHKPVNIEIDYDILDDPSRRQWAPLFPGGTVGYFETSVIYQPNATPWESLQYVVQTQKGSMPYTRFLRFRFTRRTATPQNTLSPSDLFLWDAVNNIQAPWSIEVKNMRIGRNINQIDDDHSYRYNVPSCYYYPITSILQTP